MCFFFFFTSVIAKCDRGSSGLQLEEEDKEEGGASRELLATSSPFSLLIQGNLLSCLTEYTKVSETVLKWDVVIDNPSKCLTLPSS